MTAQRQIVNKGGPGETVKNVGLGPRGLWVRAIFNLRVFIALHFYYNRPIMCHLTCNPPGPPVSYAKLNLKASQFTHKNYFIQLGN